MIVSEHLSTSGNSLFAAPMANSRINLLLVDDHALFRDGLRALLAAEKDISILGEADSGLNALKLIKKLSPDVVILDLAMPIINGFETMRRMIEIKPSTKFVILTAYCDEDYVDRCLTIGASGFVAKENAYLVLLEAIRKVAAGGTFYCPVVSKVVASLKNSAVQKSQKLDVTRMKGLTGRELQVLGLIAEGASNKQVAASLDISIKTVEKHRQQLMNKLDIHDTAGLTRYAIEIGVLERINTPRVSMP